MLKFLGIGAQKAGTTWLYTVLSQHPALGFPNCKEHHFWNRPHHEGDVAAYLAQFNDPHLVEGDITPAYALMSRDQVQEIARWLPHLRCIFLVRNPIERAWSAALMALTRAQMDLDEASDQWFIDHFRSRGSRLRGDYARTLKIWSSVFGREAILVLRFDMLASDPRLLLQRAASHLGVDAGWFDVVSDELLKSKVFSGPQVALRPSLRTALLELYQQPMLEFAAFLDEPLDWL